MEIMTSKNLLLEIINGETQHNILTWKNLQKYKGIKG